MMTLMFYLVALGTLLSSGVSAFQTTYRSVFLEIAKQNAIQLQALSNDNDIRDNDRILNPPTTATLDPTTLQDRIIFPEYNTGEVPRLYSRLDASSGQRDPGNVWGAAALVAGTTIGAGILALPVTTAAAGFLPSSCGLLVAYAFMTVAGLWLAELTLNRLGNTGKPDATGILSLYEQTLGQPWGSVGTVAYFFLHYAVMVAYVSQGGENLSMILPQGGIGGQYVFCGGIALSLAVLSKKVMEKINNLFVVGVFTTFAAIVGLGAQTADFSVLFDPSQQHPEQLIGCMPIIILAFVFQNVVPVIVKDLEGDRSKITQAIVLGTTMPLLMFLAWNAVILGNTSGAVDDNPLTMLQSDSRLAPLVSAFSSLALVTSMIGFVYGLCDAWTDVLKLPSNSWQTTGLLYSLVFLPPLVLSVANPDSFLTALEYGGAFGVSTLFLILPSICTWNERYRAQSPLLTQPMVPGGRLPLVMIGGLASALIVQQIAEKLDLIV